MISKRFLVIIGTLLVAVLASATHFGLPGSAPWQRTARASTLPNFVVVMVDDLDSAMADKLVAGQHRAACCRLSRATSSIKA